jgi:hypothetical protein
MITGQVTEQEYISAHRLHRRRMVAALNLAMIIAAAIGIALAFTASRKWGMVLLFGGIGGLFGEFFQDRISLPARLRRLYAQVRGRVDVSYAWDDEQLFVTSEHGSAQRMWTDFWKARENGDVILLYVNDARFEIVARRWFGDAGELADFRRHLRFVK